MSGAFVCSPSPWMCLSLYEWNCCSWDASFTSTVTARSVTPIAFSKNLTPFICPFLSKMWRSRKTRKSKWFLFPWRSQPSCWFHHEYRSWDHTKNKKKWCPEEMRNFDWWARNHEWRCFSFRGNLIFWSWEMKWWEWQKHWTPSWSRFRDWLLFPYWSSNFRLFKRILSNFFYIINEFKGLKWVEYGGSK